MKPQDFSAEILSEIERDKVISLAQDSIAFNAVKKYVLAVVYKQGVIEKGVEHRATVNFALNLAWPATNPQGMPRTDEELGQNLRAMTYAVQLIESGFKEMEEMRKPVEVNAETVNEAE